MARIGDYLDPSLNSYDPSPYLRAQGNATASIGEGLSQAASDFGDVLKEQREKKNEVKANAKLIESYMTLFPDSAPALEKVKNALADEDTPVSERYAMAKNTGDLISAYLIDKERAAQHGYQQQQIALEGRRVDLAEQASNLDMQNANEDRASRDELASAAGPLLLGNVLEQAKASGVSIDPELIKGLSPANQAGLAEILAKILLEDSKPIIQEVEFERNGQPYKATAQLTRDGFKVIPVQDAAPAWGDGSGGQSLPNPANTVRVPFTTYSKGGKAGPDELTDPWTEKGYSSSGKNLTPGMVAVNEKAFKLGTVFRDPKTGETFIAGDRHGNKDPRVVDFYQEPGSYKRQRGQRELEVVGFEPSVGKTPEEVQAQLQKYRGGVTPGAPKAAKESPLDIQLKEATLAEKQQSTAAQKQTADLAKSKDADMKAGAIQSAADAIRQIDSLEKDPGFNEAVGAGFYKSVGSIPGIPDDWTPAGSDKAGAIAKIEQLKGHAFLNAIQQMRGLGQLSDAEGKRIQDAAARLKTDQPEKAFKTALKEYRESINAVIQRLGGKPIAEGQAASAAAPPPTESSAAALLKKLREEEAARHAAAGGQ